MDSTQKKVFYFSLLLIVALWIYGFTKIFTGGPDIPDETSKLFIRIFFLKSITFFVVYILLRAQGDNFRSLGIDTQKLRGQILRGFGLGVGLFVFINILLGIVLNMFFPEESSSSGIMVHLADPSYLPLWILSAIFGGGFVEEFQRVFILTRFEKWKGLKIVILVLIIDSIDFGLGHLYQGVSGAISTGITGLVFGLIYLRKRSFVEAWTAHAIFDLIGIIAGHIIMQQQLN